MATRSKRAANSKRSHDRSATVQWVALCLLAALALFAAFALGDGGGGDSSGAPAVVQL